MPFLSLMHVPILSNYKQRNQLAKKMNVNYIFDKNYIKINEQKIYIGNTFSEIEIKTRLSLFVSQEDDKNTIVSEADFQLHFKENIFYMWTISPLNSYFYMNSRKIKLCKIRFNDFLKILFNENLKWEFNQTLTFSDQACIRLENKVDFIFGFDKNNTKGYLGKIGYYNNKVF